MQLPLDTRVGAWVSFKETDNPSRQQILDAVDKLDSRSQTEVSLRRDEPFEYLSISGGPDLFLVCGETPDGAFAQLTNPQADSGKVTLVCGGQASEFNLMEVVPRTTISYAVDQFFTGLSNNLALP